jgi:hypothetical protein
MEMKDILKHEPKNGCFSSSKKKTKETKRFSVYIINNKKIRRTFLVDANDANDAYQIMQEKNQKEMAEGEPIFYENETLSIGPIEFEDNIAEL